MNSNSCKSKENCNTDVVYKAYVRCTSFTIATTLNVVCAYYLIFATFTEVIYFDNLLEMLVVFTFAVEHYLLQIFILWV